MQSGVRAFSFNEGVAFVAGGSGRGIGARSARHLPPTARLYCLPITQFRCSDARARSASRGWAAVECAQLALEDSASVWPTRSRMRGVDSANP